MPIERLHRFARPAPLAIGMLCAALCLPSVVIARDANPVAVEVADAYLELHTGPGRGYPVTRVIPRGDRIEVLKRRTDWYLLRDDRGHEGWAKRQAMALTLLALSGEKPDDGFRTAEQRAAETPVAATTVADITAAETPADADTRATNVSSAPMAGPVAGPGKVARNLFSDGSYRDAESHRWEAGAGGGKGVQDLTHVIDTAGAYIPGHGTPTVILFGRRRPPVGDTVRAVMGIRGEPSTPDDPAKGLVWTAITTQVDQPGSHSDFVSVADTPRPTFHAHPWSIGGGGAAELKEVLEETAGVTLQSVAKTAIGVVTLEDDVFSAMRRDWMRPSVEPYLLGGFVEGDQVRDWVLGDISWALIPYHFPSLEPVISEKAVIRRAKTGHSSAPKTGHRVGGIEQKNRLIRSCWQGA